MKATETVERIRKQRKALWLIAAKREQAERWASFELQEREWGERQARRKAEESEREMKAAMDRIIFDVGMSMWGCDLTACMFNPKPLPVPMPPVYGGEPYKMMKIPREAT
jgi:hypothetical protein